tara:strand:- start:33302 stop:33538 length:237 start_codon:yes stop_codon:yes gene_type:complete
MMIFNCDKTWSRPNDKVLKGESASTNNYFTILYIGSEIFRNEAIQNNEDIFNRITNVRESRIFTIGRMYNSLRYQKER